MKKLIHIALVLGVLLALGGQAAARQVLVRTTARAVTREETRQTLHVVDLATGDVAPWRDTFPAMQAATPLVTSPDGAWAFMTTRGLWPHPAGWPTTVSAISAVSLDPVAIFRSAESGMLFAPHQRLGCVFQHPGSETISVLVFEDGADRADAAPNMVTLRTFTDGQGFSDTPLASWAMPGQAVQAVPRVSEPRVCVLSRTPAGASLVALDMHTHEVTADVVLSPLDGPLQGPATSLEMALTPDGERLLVFMSAFSLEARGGGQRSWLYELDADTFEFVAEPQEFPGIPQGPAPSLWPLDNGACWAATSSPGEGFAYLYRLPLTPSAPRAVEQPFANVSRPLLVAPAPAGDAVAVGVRNRLELWPDGEPAGTPLRFEYELGFVEWTPYGVLVGEAHRLHLVDPEDGAILLTVPFQSGQPSQALLLPEQSAQYQARHRHSITIPESGPPPGYPHLPDALVFRGEAVGRERRVLRMQPDGLEQPWRLEFAYDDMPWLRAHPRSGGPGQAEFSVMGVDPAALPAVPADTIIRGIAEVVYEEPGGADASRHPITVLVSPRPDGPRTILWLVGSEEGTAHRPHGLEGHSLQAAADLLASPPHWFSHRYATLPFGESLTGHDVVIVTAEAASQGLVTRQALLSYAAAGGGVLFLGAHLGNDASRSLEDWLAPIGVRIDTAAPVSGTFDVSGAPLLCRHWEAVAIENGCFIQVKPPGTTLVRDPKSGGAIFAIMPHGLGRIAFLAAPTPLEDRALSSTTHRRFVTGLVQWLEEASREVSDVDGDGLPDEIEDANQNAMVDPGETDPFNPDTDGDNVPDGFEDRSRTGRTDEGETSPLNPDTDGDGIWDGADPSPLPLAGAPVVDIVRPAMLPAEGGSWVQLSGRNFAPGMSVRFGNRAAARVRVLGPQGLDAELPPAEGLEEGLVDVTVGALDGGPSGTLPGGFRYLPLSTVVFSVETISDPASGDILLVIRASSGPLARAGSLTFRLGAEPARSVEWLEILPGADALASGRQVATRPDPEGGLWVDVSPAQSGAGLGETVIVRCRLAEAEAAGFIPEFALTRSRAFALNGVPLETAVSE